MNDAFLHRGHRTTVTLFLFPSPTHQFISFPLSFSSLSYKIFLLSPPSLILLFSYAPQLSFSIFSPLFFPSFRRSSILPPSALRPLSAPSVTNCFLSSLDNLQNETAREGRRGGNKTPPTQESCDGGGRARGGWRFDEQDESDSWEDKKKKHCWG